MTANTYTPYDGSPFGALNLAAATTALDSNILILANSVTYTGANQAAAYAHLDALGAGYGLLLSSGNAAGAGNSNTSGSFGANNGQPGDTDLTAVALGAFASAGATHDAAVLTFSFTVTSQTLHYITFDVLFGSDEYPEYSSSSYVDAAGVFVNGVNYALFDGQATHPLSVITANSTYIRNNTDGHLPIEYDGLSLPLTITAPIHQGVNTIKIAVADTGDFIYDSAIFVANMHAVALAGSGISATITGSPGADNYDYGLNIQDLTFNLGDGPDTLKVGTGNSTVNGQGGDDKAYFQGASKATNTYDGGDGFDTAYFDDTLAHLTVTYLSDGTVKVGDPTYLINVEQIVFTDQTILVSSLVPPAPTTTVTYPVPATPPQTPTQVAHLDTQFANILRAAPGTVAPAGSSLAQSQAAFTALVAQYNGDKIGALDVPNALYHLVDGTTSAANITYAFFTGATPTAAGLNYLVNSASNANDLNDGYYAAMNVDNRYINLSVGLAKSASASAAFHAAYDGLTLQDAAAKAYGQVFGHIPNDGKITEILTALVPNGLGGTESRAQYFAQLGGDGPDGIGTKAAMIGFLLADSVKEGFGVYEQANLHFLNDLAHGGAVFNVDLLGVYGPVTVGLTGTPVLDQTLG